MPKVASSIPAGKGGVSRAPVTKCSSGTGMAAARPGSASSFETIDTLCRPNIDSPPCDAGGLQDDFLVAQLPDPLRRESAGGQDLVGVLAAQGRRAPDSGRHARELQRRPHHGDLAEARVARALDDAA